MGEVVGGKDVGVGISTLVGDEIGIDVGFIDVDDNEDGVDVGLPIGLPIGDKGVTVGEVDEIGDVGFKVDIGIEVGDVVFLYSCIILIPSVQELTVSAQQDVPYSLFSSAHFSLLL